MMKLYSSYTFLTNVMKWDIEKAYIHFGLPVVSQARSFYWTYCIITAWWGNHLGLFLSVHPFLCFVPFATKADRHKYNRAIISQHNEHLSALFLFYILNVVAVSVIWYERVHNNVNDQLFELVTIQLWYDVLNLMT